MASRGKSSLSSISQIRVCILNNHHIASRLGHVASRLGHVASRLYAKSSRIYGGARYGLYRIDGFGGMSIFGKK